VQGRSGVTLPDARRVWTLEEANAVVPRLASLIADQLVRAGDIERRWKRLQAESPTQGNRPVALGSLAAAHPELAREIYDSVVAYEDGWKAVQEIGAIVKDPLIGLCDFYGQVDGKLVWLCWRYGEHSIEFYHHLDTGFAGRKPLTAATRQRLIN
jgi:hypothetical protein